jgi:hypothetical protein
VALRGLEINDDGRPPQPASQAGSGGHVSRSAARNASSRA